jgi:uncharacterized hydrophobic protein (TIGR00271 family)
MGKVYLLLGEKVPEELRGEAADAIRDALGATPETLQAAEERSWGEGDRLFLLLSDAEFQASIEKIARASVTIILLPWKENPRVRKDYLLPATIAEAVALAREEAETTPWRQLTLCNGRVVLGEVTLGEAEWLRRLPFLSWLLFLFRNLLRLRLRPFSIETAKGQQIETVALLIPGTHERIRTRHRPRYLDPADNQCSRIAAILYAPLSILSIVRLRFSLYHPSPTPGSLPLGVGTVKSRRLTVRSAGGPFPLFRDGGREFVSQAVIEALEIPATILAPSEECAGGDPEKESLRLQKIPTDREMVNFYAKRTLPLVPIAPESLFADLFSTLREGARLGRAYLLLLIVSVLMATTGLFQNSSPTIIGAMILAPLMAPIISLSMGVMRFDGALIRRSGGTLLLSVALALGTAALLAWFLPFSHLTEQMSMRTHPTLLDLAVAILSGIAAAYGTANTKVGQSLAGVAIAVALVPPLSVAGIGLGWGDYGVFEGAFLLFLANFAGIVTAAGATFYLLGFTSWRYASSAFVIKLLLLLAIAFPLWLSTRTLLREERIHRAFDTLRQIDFAGSRIQIVLKRIYRAGDELYAEVVVLLPRSFEGNGRDGIAELIRKRVGKEARLILSYQYLY